MSDLKHACHECGRNIEYPEQMFGQTVSCPHCARETSLGEVYPDASSTVSYPPPPHPQSVASASTRTISSQFYVTRDGKEFGPYTLDDVQGYLETGFLKSSDLGWCDGMQDWKPLNTIEGLITPKQTQRPPPPTQTPSGNNARKPATTGVTSWAAIVVEGIFGGINFGLLSYNAFWAAKNNDTLIWMSLQAILALACFATVLTQAFRRGSLPTGVALVALIASSSALMAYKDMDPEAADLINYEASVRELSAMEDRAIDPLSKFNEKTSDEEMRIVLRNTVIPNYESFCARVVEIRPKTAEVGNLHRQFIDAAQAQLAGFRGMEQALAQRNKNAFEAAVKVKNGGAQRITEWTAALKGLESKHKLVSEK